MATFSANGTNQSFFNNLIALDSPLKLSVGVVLLVSFSLIVLQPQWAFQEDGQLRSYAFGKGDVFLLTVLAFGAVTFYWSKKR